jgi:pimeloyl-ACP methyl ester carboxylesterase
VVVASPRGFGLSTRLQADGYSAETLTDDLLAVTAVLGLRRFRVFGYSLTGAIAASLAHTSNRVDAVVAGGFPLLGSYRRLLADVERKVSEGESNTATREAIDSDFDGRAAVAFYRYLATLPDGALVDRVSCPMYSFWGDRDEIIDTLGDGVAALEAGLGDRRIRTRVLPGLDHLGALVNPGRALPEAADWLSWAARQPD